MLEDVSNKNRNKIYIFNVNYEWLIMYVHEINILIIFFRIKGIIYFNLLSGKKELRIGHT